MLADIQNLTEGFPKKEIPLVGIEKVVYPVSVFSLKFGKFILTPAEINMYCSLSSELKGVNMSRFYGVIQQIFQKERYTTLNVREVLDVIKKDLESSAASVSVSFTYFYDQKAPVTKLEQVVPIEVTLIGRNLPNNVTEVWTSVRAPYTSCCPCSREISEDGAHNQRSYATISILQAPNTQIVTFESIVEILNATASCRIYEYLKREDEKYVTEYAYQNSKFVEDMVRDLSEVLDKKELCYKIRVEHQESIHCHNAVALYWSPNLRRS